MPRNRSKARRDELRARAELREHVRRIRDEDLGRHQIDEADRLCVICELPRHVIEASGEPLESHGEEYPHPFVAMSPTTQLVFETRRLQQPTVLEGHPYHMCDGKSDETCPFQSVKVCHAADGVTFKGSAA